MAEELRPTQVTLITQPAEPPKLENNMAELVQLSATMAVDDMVAIATESIYNEAEAAIDGLQSELKQLRAEQETLRNEQAKLTAALLKSAGEEAADRIRAALKSLGAKRTTHVDYNWKTSPVPGEDAPGVIRAHGHGGQDNEEFSASCTVVVKSSAEMKANAKAQAANDKQISSVTGDINRWKQHQADMPRHQRELRAVIARERLKGSTTGRTVLTALENRAKASTSRVRARLKHKD